MSKLWESPPKEDKFGIVVGRWFIECVPHLHPLWNHYLVVCTSLKDVEGLPTAIKLTPEMTHELHVLALNRDHKPVYNDDSTHQVLTPINYAYQFTATDEQAKQITSHAALMFQRGQLLLEISGIYGAEKINNQMMSALVRRETS